MKKEFLYGTMAFGLVLTACSSDQLGTDAPDVSDVDRTFYVNVAVRGDMSGTRAAVDNGTPVDGPDATDFDNGEGESDVKSAYFVFYDGSGNVVGDVVNVQLTGAGTPGESGTVEKYYKSVVPVSVLQGQEKPSSVICYINPISPAALTTPLNQVMTVTRQEVKNANGSFPMSNSVYYPLTTENPADPQVATPIDSNQLFETEAEANNAADQNSANILNIYVERYASKLAFKYDANKIADYATVSPKVGVDPANGTAVTLTFNPERWALNAEANDTYVVKSFRQPSTTGVLLSNNYTFDDLNLELNGLNGNLNTPTNVWNWNNKDWHRSFWGISPAYFTDKYPEVASDVDPTILHQHYYSYDELSGENAKGFDASNTTAQYFRETTVGSRAIHSNNPAAALASVILVGNYGLKVGETPITKDKTFYTYMTNAEGKALVYFEDNNTEALGAGAESIFNRLASQVTTLFKFDNTTKTYVPLTNAELKALLEVVKVSDEVLGTTGEGVNEQQNKRSANSVSLQFKNGVSTADLYVANGRGYVQIGAGENLITLTEANRILMQNVGFAHKYVSGLAYFNIPVKHYGWYREGNPNKDGMAIDWKKVQVGDFGMVRNHSYTINVNSITGLAAGIGGTNFPIVPPADTKDYYVAYRVNILQWAVVPQQDVELK